MSRTRAFPTGFVMRSGFARALLVAIAAAWLAGCNTDGSYSNLFDPKTPGTDAFASAPPAGDLNTASLGVPAPAEPGLLGGDPNDDLNLGKKYYRATNYGFEGKKLPPPGPAPPPPH